MVALRFEAETLKTQGPPVFRRLNFRGQRFAPNVVVSKDGNGNYTTISEAVESIPGSAKGSYVIYVKSGIYRENITISRPYVILVGDGASKTIVRSKLNNDDGYNIRNSAAVDIHDNNLLINLFAYPLSMETNFIFFLPAIAADNFIGKFISFENTSGPQKHQAVALMSNGDKCAFYQCSFKGYQDTLYINQGRQFFRECKIYGTIDFIFGDAAAVIQNSSIILQKPIPGQQNVITAQGREDKTKKTGIVIHNCNIITANNFQSGDAKCYLGRPWKKYSRTVIMKTYIHKAIESSGWLDMDGNHGTVVYREYDNYGPSAGTSDRVRWAGYKVLKTEEAKAYTVKRFIDGNHWLSSTGIPFTSGL
ncbi:pectinesterase-like [Asparagus officinalis]|uniref:pectinesterase-like n=1 Tax=Asparagus officinalis TaxID=4686 RepID=UPI00098E6C03|nr:pectinesterase-like [Asparagus officinalis]